MSWMGSDGSVSTSPVERPKATSAKFRPTGAGEYARGSNSWAETGATQNAHASAAAHCAGDFMSAVSHAAAKIASWTKVPCRAGHTAPIVGTLPIAVAQGLSARREYQSRKTGGAYEVDRNADRILRLPDPRRSLRGAAKSRRPQGHHRHQRRNASGPQEVLQGTGVLVLRRQTLSGAPAVRRPACAHRLVRGRGPRWCDADTR